MGNAPVKRIATGFDWVEGPVWFGDHGCLLFSDIPGNRILRWTPEGVTPFRQPSNFAKGHTRDRQGRLVSCEHGMRRVNGGERGVILAEHRRGASLGAIGLLLGCRASTIGRELLRGRPEGDPAQPYCAQRGGDRYRVLRKRCGRRRKHPGLGCRIGGCIGVAFLARHRADVGNAAEIARDRPCDARGTRQPDRGSQGA
jgi:hypothetical protein